MRGVRALALVVVGLILGLVVGSQLHGAFAGSTPCVFPTATPTPM